MVAEVAKPYVLAQIANVDHFKNSTSLILGISTCEFYNMHSSTFLQQYRYMLFKEMFLMIPIAKYY